MTLAPMTLVLRDGRADDGQPISLTLRDGVIAALDAAPGAPGVDLRGRLLLPGLIDAHVHLDKTLMGRPWSPHAGGGDVASRVAAEKRLRLGLDWDVAAQGDALLRRLSASGTTTLRTHVDIDDLVKLDNLHAVLALRERWAGRMTIGIVAFPQSGVLKCPGMPDLLDAALGEGADLVGGLDPVGFDGDMDGALDVVFGLADRHGKPADIHLHDRGPAGLAQLRAIAERTKALGMVGKVAVSHALALGEPGLEGFDETVAALAQAGVSIVTSIPGDGAFPSIAGMARAGVNLCLGSDNIRDAWSPMSVTGMIERAMLAAYRSGYRGDDQLRQCLALSIQGGARALGLEPGALAPGAAADLIVVDAPNIPAAIVERAQPDLVVRGGVIVHDRIGPNRGFPP
jgi:cytosine deaminase